MTAQAHGQHPVRRNEPGREVKYEDRRDGGRGMRQEWRPVSLDCRQRRQHGHATPSRADQERSHTIARAEAPRSRTPKNGPAGCAMRTGCDIASCTRRRSPIPHHAPHARSPFRSNGGRTSRACDDSSNTRRDTLSASAPGQSPPPESRQAPSPPPGRLCAVLYA